MSSRPILVTGATGYIASQLIPRLLGQGYRVRALARHPDRLNGRSWFPSVEVVDGDVTIPGSLASALAGVHTAYYLIHNMLSGRGYAARELEGAHNFAAAAQAAGLEHIIYLGGLADPHQKIAAHMRSRIETGNALRAGRIPVTEFRAGVIVGPGSISFEMIRFMMEQFPLLPGPTWLKNHSQPIAAQNVIDYLLAGLENAEGRGKIYEIGGPEIRTYSDLMQSYARLRGLRRRLVMLPGLPVWFMAWWVDRLTPVPCPIAMALVEGLRSDSIVQDESARRVFPSVKLIGYAQAVSDSLEQLQPGLLEPVWLDGGSPVRILKHEGFFVDCRRLEVAAFPRAVYDVFSSLGGRGGWLYANWLWQLRGLLDGWLGGAGLRGRKAVLQENDFVDYYRLEVFQPGRMMRLRAELRAPGRGWMEWRVEPLSDQKSVLTQTVFFAPRGLPGFLYWYMLYPLHSIVFRGLIRTIAAKVHRP